MGRPLELDLLVVREHLASRESGAVEDVSAYALQAGTAVWVSVVVRDWDILLLLYMGALCAFFLPFLLNELVKS